MNEKKVVLYWFNISSDIGDFFYKCCCFVFDICEFIFKMRYFW